MGFFGAKKDARRKDIWALEDELQQWRKEMARDREERRRQDEERRRDQAARQAERDHDAELRDVLDRSDKRLDWWRGRPPAE